MAARRPLLLAFSLAASVNTIRPVAIAAGTEGAATFSLGTEGICLERIGNGSYLNMAPHPDGSNRVFLSSQAGKIWLATIPEQGSGGTLQFDEANPFLDLTDEVHYDSQFGLMGIAFHPKFTTNGRLFVSYNCDRTQSPKCAGRCSCNSDANCDPSKLGTDNGAQPCQYQVVVSEYSAKVSSSNVSMATSANPSEIRRIFTMGLPYTAHHGGQILFGPTDGYLYLMMGDGGSQGDPFNFSQNKKSLLGKIMRFDIDGTQSQNRNINQSLWGNYSIPKDNPFADDSDLQPEIWALGFSNPWRCSFDSERPSYFYCGDVRQSPGGNTSLDSINAIFPVMGYDHSSLHRSLLVSDVDRHRDPGVPLTCSKSSPIACESAAGSTDPLLGCILSFGEDNSKDIFVLASKGVYRVVRPSLCGYTCPAETPSTGNGTPPPGASSSAPATRLAAKSEAVALALVVCALYSSLG